MAEQLLGRSYIESPVSDPGGPGGIDYILRPKLDLFTLE